MIVKLNGFNGVKIRESLLLPRLISVFKGVRVTLVLSNGTKITGTIKSYGKNIKTVSINSALNELQLSGEKIGDLEEVLSENEDLKNLYKTYKNKNKNKRIVSDFKSSVKLINSEVEFNGLIFHFSSVMVPESHISTLVPLNSISNHSNHKNRNDNKLEKLKEGFYDVSKMIVDQYKKELKNHAFIKCSRIGNNNIRN